MHRVKFEGWIRTMPPTESRPYGACLTAPGNLPLASDMPKPDSGVDPILQKDWVEKTPRVHEYPPPALITIIGIPPPALITGIGIPWRRNNSIGGGSRSSNADIINIDIIIGGGGRGRVADINSIHIRCRRVSG